MALVDVKVPDIGDYSNVDVIEVAVAAGDTIEEEDSLLTLETDKASMEVPAPQAGTVKEVLINAGDQVSEGDLILKLETEAGAESTSAPAPAQDSAPAPSPAPEPAGGGAPIEVHVPDIGDHSNVDVIEVAVSPGDTIEEEDSLITLETDKASMEVPAPQGGVVKEVKIQAGDKVSEGDLILLLEGQGSGAGATSESAPAPSPAPEPASGGAPVEVHVPDIGDHSNVDVIEVAVSPGDTIEEEDSLITLETDKASMEVPAPQGGVVKEVKIQAGDKVSEGDLILLLEGQGGGAAPAPASQQSPAPSPSPSPAPSPAPAPQPQAAAGDNESYKNEKVYAGPAVRRLARILGADLTRIKPTGPKGRITKADCEAYIKNVVTRAQQGEATGSGGGGGGSELGLLPDPDVDFTKFGEVEEEPLTKINKLSARNLHRNWVKIPHVTFYDDADITELEAFRKAKKADAEKLGVKISPLAFIVKAAAVALQDFKRLNSSLSADGERIIYKHYYHIGFAADTPKGLIVPVIRDVDKKGIYDISREMADLIARGREGKVKPDEMKGATFTVSSLGILGTTGFTPIINMPEVAILGVSKTATKPVYDGKEFVPRSMLPLSLSVDHRVIDGALAAKFMTRLTTVLGDLREMLL